MSNKVRVLSNYSTVHCINSQMYFIVISLFLRTHLMEKLKRKKLRKKQECVLCGLVNYTSLLFNILYNFLDNIQYIHFIGCVISKQSHEDSHRKR